MKSVEELIEDEKNGVHHDYLLFWGHQPSKTGEITKSCLSQWWMSSFVAGGQTYCCAEQYMMAMKAKLFLDLDTERLVLNSNDPKEIKRLGRIVKGFSTPMWDREKYGIVYNGNYAKFSQSDRLLDFLMSTGDKVLAEASPYDTVWGIGWRAEDPMAKNPATWRGENLLGFALMAVRETLRY